MNMEQLGQPSYKDAEIFYDLAQKLPPEVIVDIMKSSDLSITDILSASLTCTQWCSAINSCPQLLDSTFVRLTSDKETKQFITSLIRRDTNNSFHCQRIFTRFQFSDSTVDFPDSIWIQYGPNIKSFSFTSCGISENQFHAMLSSCQRLEELNFNGCGPLFMSGTLFSKCSDITLKNLKTLNIQKNTYLSDLILNSFVKIAPNLNKLAIVSCKISSFNAIYLKYYTEANRTKYLKEIKEGKVPLDVACNVITLQNICGVMSIRKIISLDLSDSTINYDGVLKICTANAQLQELILSRCKEIKRGIKEIASHFRNSLKVLDISHCNGINEVDLHYLSRLENLERLNLDACASITSEIIMELQNLKKLKSINLSNLNLYPQLNTNSGIYEGLKNIPNLQELIIKDTINLEEIYPLLNETCNLRVFIFEGIGADELDTEICRALAKHTSLHTLEMQIRYPMQFQSRLWNTSVSRMFFSLDLSILPSLKSLNLSKNMITDDSFPDEFKLNDLVKLNLSRTNIRNLTLQKISEFCPILEELSLENCDSITDDGINLLTKLKRLKQLKIMNTRVSSACLQYIESVNPFLKIEKAQKPNSVVAQVGAMAYHYL